MWIRQNANTRVKSVWLNKHLVCTVGRFLPMGNADCNFKKGRLNSLPFLFFDIQENRFFSRIAPSE